MGSLFDTVIKIATIMDVAADCVLCVALNKVLKGSTSNFGELLT